MDARLGLLAGGAATAKSRRAKLTADKLATLAGPGLAWAATEGAA
ncbi:hypothetical protein ABZ820_22045 [Streptomyces diacarni]